MSLEDHQQRVTLYLPRGLYNSILLAAADAGESVRHEIICRLASTLTVPEPRTQSSCAGKGGAPAVVSPALSD
jgi:hypothetical protein